MVFKKHISPDDIFASFLEHPQFTSFGEQEVLFYNWEGTLVPKKVSKVVGDFFEPILEVEMW
jgi:hypothetical protein